MLPSPLLAGGKRGPINRISADVAAKLHSRQE
jgi:hypothetical protein